MPAHSAPFFLFGRSSRHEMLALDYNCSPRHINGTPGPILAPDASESEGFMSRSQLRQPLLGPFYNSNLIMALVFSIKLCIKGPGQCPPLRFYSFEVGSNFFQRLMMD